MDLERQHILGAEGRDVSAEGRLQQHWCRQRVPSDHQVGTGAAGLPRIPPKLGSSAGPPLRLWLKCIFPRPCAGQGSVGIICCFIPLCLTVLT